MIICFIDRTKQTSLVWTTWSPPMMSLMIPDVGFAFLSSRILTNIDMVHILYRLYYSLFIIWRPYYGSFIAEKAFKLLSFEETSGVV